MKIEFPWNKIKRLKEENKLLEDELSQLRAEQIVDPNTTLRNCHHPDFAHLVEKAFIGHGVHSDRTQYYKFKGDTELDMIAGRYNKAARFFVEAELKMSSQDMLYYLDHIEKATNPKGNELSVIDMTTEIRMVVKIMRERVNLLIENKSAMKLASASYFDETEVLDNYDFEYNMKKIDAWEKGGDYSFFFIKPLSDLLPLSTAFKEDSQKLKDYMTLAETTMQKLHMSLSQNTGK